MNTIDKFINRIGRSIDRRFRKPVKGKDIQVTTPKPRAKTYTPYIGPVNKNLRFHTPDAALPRVNRQKYNANPYLQAKVDRYHKTRGRSKLV